MKIFFSYPHDANAPLIERIKSDLEARGHEVWFDAAQIKSGDDWRNAITRGILDSQQVVAFLSKHAVRDPGVCLNEIAIALADKGEAMVTVLVEPETEVNAPVSITHIQWLKMEDWQSREQDPGWYKTQLDRLVEAIENPSHAGRNEELETLRLALDPMSFYAEIAPHILGFVGRRWIIDRYNTWLADEPQSRVLRIEGGPGLGKTAVTSYLAHSAKSSVLGVHLCQFNAGESRNPLRLVRTLAYQLATRLPDYRARLLKSVSILKPETMQGKDPASLWSEIIAAPLTGVGKGNIDRQRLAIIIDGLDEATVDGKNPIVELLATEISKLPTWIGVVLTGRPDPELTQRLSRYKPMVLSDDDPQNLADLKVYVDDWLATEVKASKLTASQAQAAGNALLAKSQGAFLYLRQARIAVSENMLDLTQPHQFPSGLAEIYQRFFERRFPDVADNSGKYKTWVRPLLELVLASPAPLPLSIAKELLKWGPYDGPKTIASIGSLLKCTKGGQGNEDEEMLAPFHNSVCEWLQNADAAGDFFVSCDEAQLPLTEAVWRKYLASNEQDAYGIAVLPELLESMDSVKWRSAFGSPAQKTVHALFRFGDNLRDTFRLGDAATIYGAATLLSDRLCATDPKNPWFAGDRCVSLSRSGDIAMAIGETKLAIDWYESGLQIADAILHELGAEPSANALPILHFAKMVGAFSSRLGDGLMRQGKTREAQEAYLTSAAITEQLAEGAPENIEHARDTIVIYQKLGDADGQLSSSTAALAYYQKALFVAQRLATSSPDDTTTAALLSDCYNKIGDAHRYLGDARLALVSYRQSAAIAENLAMRMPGTVEGGRRLCVCLGKVGDMLSALGNFQLALGEYQKSASIADQLTSGDHNNVILAREQFATYAKLGDIYLALEDTDLALANYQQSVKTAQLICFHDPSSAKAALDLCVGFGKLGNSQKALGRHQAAAKSYDDSLAIAQQLVALNTENIEFSSALCIAYSKQGDIQSVFDNFSLALESYQKSAALADLLTKRDPTNTAHVQYLCVTYSQLGDTQMILGASDAALVCYQKYLAIARQLVAIDNDNIQFNRELYLAHYKIGEAQSSLGAYDAAMEAYQSSTTITEHLVALHPQSHEFALARDATYGKQAQLSKTDVDKTLSSFWAEQILRQAE